MTIRSEAQRRLLERMAEDGLNHEDVAKRIGKARPTVTNIVNGRRLPDIVTGAAIEDAFDIASRLWAQKPRGGVRNIAA